MTLSCTPFEKFDAACQTAGLKTALDELASYLVDQKRYHELFELRKIQLRSRLELPIDRWQPIDELPEEKGQALEQGLLTVCREIGRRFLEAGDVANGWQYLEPVGDRAEVGELLRRVDVTDENVEALIQVSVGQGIEPELGFGLVLERFGTCSSITTFESQLAGQPIQIRRGPAAMLVKQLYDELSGRLQQAVQDQEGELPVTQSLTGLMDGRDWLFEGLNHHIDTTHLASVVRISRILDDESSIRMAIELAQYGIRLHDDFHYAGQAPFENTYADILQFLQALVGIEPEVTLQRMASAATADGDQRNRDPAVWYVYLLDQTGHGEQATRAYLELIHFQQAESMISEDVCPGLATLVGKYHQFELAKKLLLQQGDLLAYATVSAIEAQVPSQSD